MSDKKLRKIIAIVIFLLIIFQIGTLIASIFGLAWGSLAAVFVMVVSFFSARLARSSGKRSFWFLLPTLLFTVLPIALTFWETIHTDTTWVDRLARLTPFLVGFALPVILLFMVYFELRKRTIHNN